MPQIIKFKIKTKMLLDSLLPDTSRLTADIAVEFIIEHPRVFRDFLDASMIQEYPLSMRASRVIYLVAREKPHLIKPYIKEILDTFPGLHDQSVIRNLLHIFDNFIDILPEKQLGQLLSLCFSYVEDLHQAIAVRTYSLKLLYLISQQLPGIKPELVAIINFHLPESPNAFKSQAKQIIRKLNKEIIQEL
jgi:hypothetical protein